MKKQILTFILVLATLAFALQLPVYANVFTVAPLGAAVSVRIESYDQTLAEGQVSAFTFWEALQKLCAHSQLDIQLIQNMASKEVSSVSGIANGSVGGEGEWNAYLVRDGIILEPENVLDQLLRKKDEVVLYYGHSNLTKKAETMQVFASRKTVTVSLLCEYVEWRESIGSMIPTSVTDPITDAVVHVLSPAGEKSYPLTEEGNTSFTASFAAIYEAYAEGYKKNALPSIVKTRVTRFSAGFENDLQLTRGELVGALIDYFSIKENGTAEGFSDVTSATKYSRQIRVAQSNEIVQGCGDTSFQPDRPVKFVEACIIFSKLLNLSDTPADLGGVEEIFMAVPDYAKDAVRNLYYAGALLGVTLNFQADLSRTTLDTILDNLDQQGFIHPLLEEESLF